MLDIKEGAFRLSAKPGRTPSSTLLATTNALLQGGARGGEAIVIKEHVYIDNIFLDFSPVQTVIYLMK